MPLAERLASSTNAFSPNSECQTCRFLASVDDTDRQAFAEWVAAGNNMAELHRLCQLEGLAVTYRNFMLHFEKNHHGAR